MFGDVVFLLLGIRFLDKEVFSEQMNHRFVKAVEVGKEIVGVVHKTPLTACIFITPSVPFAREINPFGMSELVAHKGEVTAVDS